MSESYRVRIEAFCQQAGIVLPSGLYRHALARYAVVDIGQTPNQLVARTWGQRRDVTCYLTHLGGGRTMRVLDFKDGVELSFDGGNSFSRVGEL